MAKRKPITRIKSYGIYSKWDSQTKELPKIRQFTSKVPAEIDVEFGMIVNVKGAKNLELDYCIDHPGIVGADGNCRPPFGGSVFVKTNDWDFYLGDTIWDPIEDKLGIWRMTLELEGAVIADKIFQLVLGESSLEDSD